MSDLRMGTVAALNPITITAEGSTVPMPADVWLPVAPPSVGDRVLYDVVSSDATRGGRIVVMQNVTSPRRELGGTVIVPVTTGGTAAHTHVTFPAGWFDPSDPIQVLTSAGGGAPGTVSVSATTISVAGCEVWAVCSSAANVSVFWLAFQN